MLALNRSLQRQTRLKYNTSRLLQNPNFPASLLDVDRIHAPLKCHIIINWLLPSEGPVSLLTDLLT